MIGRINEIPIGYVISDEPNNEQNYNIPTATVVEEIQEIEMVDFNTIEEEDVMPSQNIYIFNSLKKCLFRCLAITILTIIFIFCLHEFIYKKNNNNNKLPTHLPTLKPAPYVNCDNSNCTVTIWESRQNIKNEIIGTGLNISFSGSNDIRNDSYKLNKFRPNLNNKVSILELSGSNNCSIMFADLKLNSSQWTNCDFLYKCETKFNGIYDLSNEAYSSNYKGKITESWENKIGSILINNMPNCDT